MLEIMLVNTGVEMAKKGQLRHAEEAFRQAAKVNPNYAQAYSNLGFVLYNTKRLAEAEACCRQAIRLKPDFPDAYNNLSLILMDTERLEEAETCLRAALGLNGKSPEINNNLGLVLEDTDRRAEAETLYRQAIKLNPDFPDAHYNLGNILKSAHRLDEAERAYRRALKLRPAFRAARFALATLYLLDGQYEKGWESYNTLRMAKTGKRINDIPRWQGEDLTGRNILLYHEQGFGDTIQFVRYAEKVARAAATTVLRVQKPLERLMVSSFASLTVQTGDGEPEGRFDFACPLPDLPMLFKTTVKTIPRNVPYLRADGEIAGRWRSVLNSAGGEVNPRVGVVWAGNAKHHNDRNRSIPFSLFSTLVDDIANVRWISLQVGPSANVLPDGPKRIMDVSPNLVDFAETAGLIENLDLVITVDSAVAHLSGALGKETWLLVPFAPDWRWLLDRQDSPWYPALRLFRQPKFGNWQDVLSRIGTELARKFL